MSGIEINGPIKIDRLFVSLFCAGFVTTFICQTPWRWHHAHLEQVAGLLLYPLASTMILYSLFGLGAALFVGTKDERFTSVAFFSGVSSIGVVLFILWAIFGFGRAFWWVSLLGVIAGYVAYAISLSARGYPKRRNRGLDLRGLQ